MQFIQIISFLLGVICVVLFIPPLIIYRILNIGNATGLLVGMLLILYGVFAKIIHAKIHTLWKSVWGKALVSIAGTMILCCVLLAVIISACMIRTVTKKPEGDVPLLVLGCQVKGTHPSLMLTERLEAADKYLKEHDNAVCILSGGQGEDEGISEAECMYNYLIGHGISTDRLIMEPNSTSTRENLQFSLEIMEEHNLGNTVAIVTNEFHEYRAFKIAEKLDIEPYAVAANTHWWMFPTYLVREWYGVIYEWLGMTHRR